MRGASVSGELEFATFKLNTLMLIGEPSSIADLEQPLQPWVGRQINPTSLRQVQDTPLHLRNHLAFDIATVTAALAGLAGAGFGMDLGRVGQGLVSLRAAFPMVLGRRAAVAMKKSPEDGCAVLQQSLL